MTSGSTSIAARQPPRDQDRYSREAGNWLWVRIDPTRIGTVRKAAIVWKSSAGQSIGLPLSATYRCSNCVIPPIGSLMSRTRTDRSEEHTSELESLMRTSYAVFCLKTKQNNTHHHQYIYYSTHTSITHSRQHQ